MGKSRYISLVGIDGAGKTTQIRNVSRELRKRGHQVSSHQQFKTGLGLKCREVLSTTFDPYLRAFLFALDHYAARERILGLLEKNDFVISDRSFYCSVAYLSPRGISEAWVLSLYRYLPKPDTVILLDIPIEVAAERKPLDELVPVKNMDFLCQVREYYLELAGKGFLIRVDGNMPEEEVTHTILQLLTKRELRK